MVESKAMPVRRKAFTVALTVTPPAVLLEIGERGLDLLQRVGGERLQVEDGVVGERLLQVGHGRARRGAEQPEGGFRFNGERQVGKA